MNTAAEAVSAGRQARKNSDLRSARAHYAAGAEMYRQHGDHLACAHALRHVADMHLHESNIVEAKPLYEEALAIYRGNLETKLLELANTVRPYALLNERLGDIELARELWQEARNLYFSLRIDAGVAECVAHLETLRQP